MASSTKKLDPSQALHNIFKALDFANDGVISSRDFSRVLNLTGLQQKRQAREHLAVIGKYQVPDHQDPKANIDYERFMVDGQCVQLRGLTDSIVPPVEPWANENKKRTQKPPPLAIATNNNEESHWEAHVRAFQQRRIKAASSLFGRVQRARRQLLVREAVQRRLQRDALRASTLVALEGVVSTASKQRNAQDRAKMWLLERLFHARRHALRRSEALHRLGELGAWSVAAALAGARESTNQTRVWPLWYMARQSTKWLHTVGKVQVLHSAKKREAMKMLVLTGQKALAVLPSKNRRQKQLCQIGIKAGSQRRKREGVLIRCFKKSDRAKQSLAAMKEAAEELSFIGSIKAIDALEPRAGAVAHLHSVGRSVAVVVFKDQLTGWWLNDTGAQAVRHIVAQRRARAYLAKRKKDATKAKLAQLAAAENLTRIGDHAVQHWGVICRAAHLFIRERVSLVTSHRAAMERARGDLMEGLNHAAVTKSIAQLVLDKPQRLAELAADVKRNDMKKERERRGLPLKDRFRLEMEEAFQYFDLDGSGEIGRFEFLAMMKGGRIFSHIDKTELEDIFIVMDKDGSGAIDFDEFWSWLLFELDNIPGRGKSLTVANILPIRDRAARALLIEEKEKQKTKKN